MSRTDKTAPYWVKQYYEARYLEPVHRHELHDCNLPPRPTAKEWRDSGGWNGRLEDPCFWWVSHEFWNSRWGKCPCALCHGFAYDFGNPKHPKRRRINERRYVKGEWRKEY